MTCRYAKNPDILVEVKTDEDAGEKRLMTLRQALLCTRCADDNAVPLFISVDWHFLNQVRVVSVTYHQTLRNEATMFLTYLPLLLSARFGQNAWQWFYKSEAELEMGMYFFDPTTGTIKDADEQGTGEALFEEYTDHIRGDEANKGKDQGFDIDEDSDDDEEGTNNVQFHLEVQIDLHSPLANLPIFDCDRSMATFCTGVTAGTLTTAVDAAARAIELAKAQLADIKISEFNPQQPPLPTPPQDVAVEDQSTMSELTSPPSHHNRLNSVTPQALSKTGPRHE